MKSFLNATTMISRTHVLLFALALGGCSAVPPQPVASTPVREPPNQSATRVTALSIVESLPTDAEPAVVNSVVDRALPLMFSAPSSDRQTTLDALAVLRNQPAVVSVLAKHYRGLPNRNYQQRMFTLQVLGELRSEDAMPHLHAVVMTVLPEKTERAEGFSPRELEEMVQVQAVNGIAFLRNKKSDAVVLELMQGHESRAVRIAAVNAFMWNKADGKEAEALLYKVLPDDLHPYIGMPRVHRGMNADEFRRRLSEWRRRWVEE